MATVTQLMQDQVTQLYIGFFGRAPDAVGFSYWTNAMSNGASQQQIANSFALSPEFSSNYNGLTPTQQITKLYNNVLNRAPDTAGLNFWVAALNNGATLPSIVVSILNSTVAQGTSTADGNLILNKTAVGEYFAINLASNNTAAAATAFTNVTSDPATVVIAENALNVSAANQINITSPAVGTFNGGSGANAFIANTYIVPNTGAIGGATLVNGDVLNGSVSGPNTLQADLCGTSVTTAQLNNIGNYVLSNSHATNAGLLNVASAGTIASSFTLNNPVSNITVSGVSSNTPTVTWNGSSSNSTAAFTLTAASGAITSNRSAAVSVNNVLNATDSAYANQQGYLTVDSQYAGLNLSAIGTDTINTGFVGRNNYGTGGITISGAGNLTLGGSGSATIAAVAVNASALTGNLTTTLSDAVTTNFSSGAGNDTIRLNNNAGGGTTISLGAGTNYVLADKLEFLTSGATLTGGAGSDTLALSALDNLGGAGLLRNMSAMDTLRFAAGNGSSATNLNSVTFGTNLINAGFTAITSTGTGDIVTLQSIPTAFTGLTFTGVGTGGADTLVLQTAGGTFTVSNYNVTADSSSLSASTITIAGTGNTTVGASGANTQTLNFGSAARQTLTLAGTSRFAVTGSAATGSEVILGANTGTTGGATTVTGGAGGLTVDTSASAAANTFNFAAGGTNKLIDNNMSHISAAASIVGGAGTDTLSVTAASTMGAVFDTTLSKVSAFDVLALTANGAGTSNLITLGTNFANAGFSSVTGMGTMDQVTLLGATPSQAITFTGIAAGGTGTNVLVVQTSSGTFTVNGVGTTDLTNAGYTASTITVGGTGQSFVDGGTAASTINFGSAASQTLSVRAANTLTVNAGQTTNDQVILLGSRGITVNSVGANSNYIDSQNSTAAHTINLSSSSVTNTVVFKSIQQASASASLVGGAGTDILKIAAVDTTGANAAASMKNFGTGWNTLTLTAGGAGTSNQLTLGTNFVNAGFTTVNGLGTADQITVTGATLNSVTFSGGVGTGTDSLILNTAGGTVTVVNFANVTGNGAANTLTIGTTGTANIGVSLLAGSSVIDANTNNSTIVMSGATTFTGNMGSETITLGGQGTFATTINGGGGNDVLYLQGNTSGTTVTAGGNTGTFSIVGGFASSDTQSGGYSLTASGGGQYVTTNVQTFTFSANSAAGISADMTFNNTGARSAIYTYTLNGNDTAAFSIGTGSLATGGYFALTVNSSANDTILISNANWNGTTQSANVFINAMTGTQTITLGSGGFENDTIGVNLNSLGASTNTANGFIVTGWGTGNDAISLGGTGATLASANQAAAGTQTVLNTAYLNTNGVLTNTNSFSLGSTFVTGTSTTLANLATSGTNSGLIFDLSTSVGSGTNFTTQAGINTAVTYITTNIGSTVAANQKAVLAVHDANSNTALFLWTNGSDTTGISSNELKLIGVLNGVSATSASSYI